MKISSFKIESPRLLLRNYTLSDARRLYQLIDSNKKLLADYFPATIENTSSVMATRKYILDRNSDRKNGVHLFAGVFLKDGKTLIGQVLAKDINWRVPKCELGYFMDQAYHGKGLGSEAVNYFSAYCFEKLGIEKIALRIEPKNKASKKLAKKCAFDFIGLSKNDFRSTEGRLMDCELWERIK
jgi:RimJ/RimL family protein N-acetyltransferase